MNNLKTFFSGLGPLILIMNIIAVYPLRALVFDFLIGSTGRQNAALIKRKATRWKRLVTMGYIRPHLVQDIKAFRIYYGLYIAYLISFLPQLFLAFIMVYYVGVEIMNVYRYYCFVHMGVALILSLIKWPLPSCGPSRYAKRKEEKDKRE